MKQFGETQEDLQGVWKKNPGYLIHSWKACFQTFLQQTLRQIWDNFFCTFNTIMEYFKYYVNAMSVQEKHHF